MAHQWGIDLAYRGVHDLTSGCTGSVPRVHFRPPGTGLCDAEIGASPGPPPCGSRTSAVIPLQLPAGFGFRCHKTRRTRSRLRASSAPRPRGRCIGGRAFQKRRSARRGRRASASQETKAKVKENISCWVKSPSAPESPLASVAGFPPFRVEAWLCPGYLAVESTRSLCMASSELISGKQQVGGFLFCPFPAICMFWSRRLKHRTGTPVPASLRAAGAASSPYACLVSEQVGALRKSIPISNDSWYNRGETTNKHPQTPMRTRGVFSPRQEAGSKP